MRGEVMTPVAAWAAFDGFASDDRGAFYAEPANDDLQTSFRQLTTVRRFPHQQWPDAYLAAFAKAGGLTIVTFDRGLKALAGKEARLLR
jgi:predicted nucleic acid-binding protein